MREGEADMRSNLASLVSLASLAMTSLGACTTTTDSGITASELTCPTDSTLTYANFGEQFFADNCLSCHGSRNRPALATQAQIRANANLIIDQAVTSTRMPQSSSMSVDERSLLGEWLT